MMNWSLLGWSALAQLRFAALSAAANVLPVLYPTSAYGAPPTEYSLRQQLDRP